MLCFLFKYRAIEKERERGGGGGRGREIEREKGRRSGTMLAAVVTLDLDEPTHNAHGIGLTRSYGVPGTSSHTTSVIRSKNACS